MNAVNEEITPAWIKQLQILVNKALSLDEETLHSLGELEGKVIAFEFINTQLILFIFPSEQGLEIKNHYDNKADVSIKGTPGNFVMMMASSKESKTRLPSDMQLTGDIGLAQRFQEIMQSIEIDLEEPLSRWVGDTMAYQLGRFIRGTHRLAIYNGKNIARDISEYLRFEIEMLPDDLLVEEYCKSVDELRDDVDRFKQRVSKLETQLNKDQGN